MFTKLQRDREESLAGNVERLQFIGEMSDRLARAEDPFATLNHALGNVTALLGAETCRLHRLRDGAAPSLPPIKTPTMNLRAVIWNGEEPTATIVATAGKDTAAFGVAETSFLSSLAQVASLALAKSQLKDRLATQERFGYELDGAVELQQRLQPDCVPDRLPIWGVNLPARKLSGDFFDFFRLDDDRIAFTLGDVSGKGIDAALLMAKTVSLFRCLGKRIEAPAQLLAAVNAELCETATRGMFVTMIAGQYCPSSGRVTFANAGHEPPLLRRPDRSYDTFPAAAPPLGILPSIILADENIELAGGEFYLFTDGLTEYRYDNGEMLGVEGLIQLVEAFAQESPARRLEMLLETLDWEGGWVARDDVTVLAIDDSWVRPTGSHEAEGNVARSAPDLTETGS